MGKPSVAIILILFVLISSGCSNKIVFTPQLRTQLEQQRIDLKKVQFYNSEKITMSRIEDRPQELVVNDGELEVTEGRIIEEIVIKKNTPGICSGVNQYHLNIVFEDDRNQFLKFGRKQGSRLGNRYKLYAQSWNEEYGIVSYGDTLYQTGKNAANAHLLVKKSQIYDLIREKRVARGRKIDDNRTTE